MLRSLRAALALPLLATALAAAPVATPEAKAATPATATASVNLRAGPGTAYPVVTTLPPSAALTVFGCLADTSWCDVVWGSSRGWVAANYIAMPYDGRVIVLTPAIAPAVGVAVVTFSRAYWDRYYVGRPWYGRWGVYHPVAPRGGAVVGCGPNGCAGAVVRPRGVAVGGCNDDVCRGAVVRRDRYGNVVVRRGSVTRP